MPSEEEIQAALLAIHSRLGAIEGKVNLVARAERDELLVLLRGAVENQPLIGQIYLLLDGSLSQKEVLARLHESGVDTSIASVSRRMEEMETELGIADVVPGGRSKVLRKDPEMERVLNLSTNMRRWLTDTGQVVPNRPAPKRRRRA